MIKNTWCPGCGNFPLMEALKRALAQEKKERLVLVAGIGCHGKIADYIKVNSFCGLHGRALPVAEGIKIANPDLKVVCSSGDGDSYNEGIAHLIHAAKRNSDITVIIHDNQNFALTVKQYTSTSPKGFIGSSTPFGSTEQPINPMELILSAGATFVARGYSPRIDHLAGLIKQGINHQGFSFIEVLQPCVTWYNTLERYNRAVYEIDNRDYSKEEAMSLAQEWSYDDGDKIPIGLFYQEERLSFDKEAFGGLKKKRANLKTLLKNYA